MAWEIMIDIDPKEFTWSPRFRTWRNYATYGDGIGYEFWWLLVNITLYLEKR